MDIFPSPIHAVLTIMVILSASIIQGITGFGYAVLSAPILFALLPKETVVTVYAVISLALNLFLASRIRGKIPGKLLIPFSLASIIGLPLGIFLLTVTSQKSLLVEASLLSICMIPFILFKKQIRIPRTILFTTGIGVLTGLLQTSTSINGPLVAAYFSNILPRKTNARKSMAGYFSMLAIISLVLLLASGNTATGSLIMGVLCIPAAILGGIIGNSVSENVPEAVSKTLTIALILFTAAGLL